MTMSLLRTSRATVSLLVVTLASAACVTPTTAAEAAVGAAGEPAGPTIGIIIGPGLRVTDLDRSKRFYTDGLGMTFAGKLELPNVTELIFAFGPERRPPVILLLKGRDAAASAPVVQGNGYSKTVLEVSDAEAVAARLQRAGYAPGELNVNPKTGFKGFSVSDPDGYRYEVTQRPSRSGPGERRSP